MSDQLAASKEHVERIRRKAVDTPAIGDFWRSLMLGALSTIDAQREQVDRYGLVLMMIREGCADPAEFAGAILQKNKAVQEAESEASPQ